jgi:uncharacterized protein YceH (UPF0502 family)
MHMSELTPPEQRVLGCLIEKRFTTPDQYPLSLNSLRLACNQSTNRDPVTDYDEATVREAAQRLTRYGLVRLASGHGSRATKYRHLADEALALSREQLAVLAVLLLRGPQTPGELRQRTERMARLDSPAAVERILGALIERGFAARLERRPGQKEERFAQLLGGEDGNAPAPSAAPPTSAPLPTAAKAPTTTQAPTATRESDLAERVARLEREVAELRAALTGGPAPPPERADL